MTAIIFTGYWFAAILVCFGLGAVGSLALRKQEKIANIWSGVFSIIGSTAGILFGITGLTAEQSLSVSLPLSTISNLISFTFNIDQLAAFFIFVISLIALFASIYGLGYVKHYFGKYDVGSFGFFYNLFIAGMLLVVSASNAIVFLVAWELMSLASYFLVVFEHDKEENVNAGFLYFVMTHIGTAFILLFFLLVYKFTGTFDFTHIKEGIAMMPPLVRDFAFIFALIGFGTKAGVIPLHIWLPSAHPAAPSHVSALMSGVMIKTGIYMIIRVVFFFFVEIPLWWGLLIVVIGAVSSVLGVLYALTEHDIKKLLAYSSIENIGIILLGIGSALSFYIVGQLAFAIMGIVAALFHTLNHAVFKSLLFLGAGSVIQSTHTRNIEEYGGLIKRMPETAMFFIVGSMAISALPPFNGFFSEWITYQSLFPGIVVFGSWGQWIFILATAALAVTGGLALACFVKACGATFLARPRSHHAENAEEAKMPLRIAMATLSVLTLVFGVASGFITKLLIQISSRFLEIGDMTIMHTTAGNEIVIGNNFAFVSPVWLFGIFALFIIFVWFLVRYAIYPKQKVKTGPTWDCGTDLTPRMEITSTGFARSIILVFKGVLRPTIQKGVVYRDDQSRYFPKSRTVNMHVGDLYRNYFYNPIIKFVDSVSLRAKSIQTGNLNTYIIYILITIIAALYIAVH